MNKAKLFLLITFFALALSTSSCSRGEDVFAFAQKDASFTLTFPSHTGDVILHCVRDGERITATVESPERSCGIAISCDGGDVTVRVDEVTIPLSGEAALGYCSIFDVMYRGAEGAAVTKSEDGEHTLIIYENGTLTLDEHGMPAEIDVGQTVWITNYLTED